MTQKKDLKAPLEWFESLPQTQKEVCTILYRTYYQKFLIQKPVWSNKSALMLGLISVVPVYWRKYLRLILHGFDPQNPTAEEWFTLLRKEDCDLFTDSYLSSAEYSLTKEYTYPSLSLALIGSFTWTISKPQLSIVHTLVDKRKYY